MTKKSHLAAFVYQMFNYGKQGLDKFVGHSGKEAIQTRFPRPCLHCGVEHYHNNAFCSVSHCEQWRAENPNQGKPNPEIAAYVNSLIPSISVPDYLRREKRLNQ